MPACANYIGYHGRRAVYLLRRARIAVCLVAILVLTFVVNVAAGPFSSVIIFGDSLSDIGNVSQATFGITPGPFYYNGRFTNGPVYAEILAEGLGLPPLLRSRAGGTDFAHGGAKTAGTSFPNSLFVRDVDDQVGDFLARGNLDPNALFVVWAGANDLLDGQTNMSVPVSRLATDLNRLFSAGARFFLIPNLPPLGYTPRYNGDAAMSELANARTNLFNTTLASMLDALATSQPAMTLFRLDIAAMFLEVLADPSAFGFINVSDSAAPGLEPGAGSYDSSQIVANPSHYLFWDDLHPTSAAHAWIGQSALQLLAVPGDVNGDGLVDAADYVTWRKKGGSLQIYETWRWSFASTANGESAVKSSSPGVVPEPNGLIMLLTIGLVMRFRPNVAQWRLCDL